MSLFSGLLSRLLFSFPLTPPAELFPRPVSGDQDPDYLLYQTPDLAKSREMAKELILTELNKCAEHQRTYTEILGQMNDAASDGVKEAAANVADDSYVALLQEWNTLLKGGKLSETERNFLYTWLNRTNAGVLPARLAFDDCAVEASKNPNALRLNPMADPSRVDIAKVSELLSQE